MGVVIYRTRRTREVWRRETRRLVVAAGTMPAPTDGDTPDPALLIEFDIDVAGGGGTRIMVGVTPDAFERLMSAMRHVDRAATEAAFASVMAKPRSSG